MQKHIIINAMNWPRTKQSRKLKEKNNTENY